MATALASAATGRLVRDDVAMTGEISLRGRVLPIGGIKERRSAHIPLGHRTILLPRRNEVELEDLPRAQYSADGIPPGQTLDEVMAHALHKPGDQPGVTLGNMLELPRDSETVQAAE